MRINEKMCEEFNLLEEDDSRLGERNYILRSIVIIFGVLEHSIEYQVFAGNLILLFCTPLFFMISGMLANPCSSERQALSRSARKAYALLNSRSNSWRDILDI